jgi:hypothetical protein
MDETYGIRLGLACIELTLLAGPLKRTFSHASRLELL